MRGLTPCASTLVRPAHTPDDPADAPSHWQRYGFDGAGRLNAVSSPAGEYSYTYVDQSHLLASVSGPVHTVTNSYESGRDTMTAKVNATSSSTISRFGARYDALGRRVEITRSGSAFAQNFVSDYQYDLLGQLTKDERFAGEVPGDPAAKLEGESFSFLYDGIGNRLTAQKGTDTTAYTPNALNQYTAIDGIEPVYDADGNLFSDGKNRYHWDAENRLTLVEPLVPTEGSKRLEFHYDYIGRRVSKQVWTHTGGSWTDTSTTAFVYDGWNLIEEVSTSSQTASINHYTWGLDLSGSLQGAGGVGGLLSVVCAPFTESGLIGDWLLPIGYVSGPAPSTFHYTFDLNGNVSEVLDSTGSIAAHYEYSPFGELTHEFHSSNSHFLLLTFNFSTKYYDAELNTLYYGYRYYDPTTGRWLNRDPLGEEGGINLYGFVGNNSISQVDKLGLYTLGDASARLKSRGVTPAISATSGYSPMVGVYVPGSPARYSDQQIFDEWYRLEKTQGAWWTGLPKCPRKICVRKGRGRNRNLNWASNIYAENPSDWFEPARPSRPEKLLHPGTAWSMRSRPEPDSGHANQCTYDDDGNLLREPAGAGTVDWGHVKSLAHYPHDVEPAILASNLDGNGKTLFTGSISIVGSNVRKYYEVRPLWAK